MEGEKILIAEPDIKIAELASIKLSNAGYVIITADDGDKAVEKAFDNHPDLLLIGLNLTGKNGLEVCYEVKMNPELAGTPVVLIVDRYFDDGLLINARIKIDDLLAKPFSPKNLLGIVNSHITKFRLLKKINPKTLLPGKVHLQEAVESIIKDGDSFDLVFCDLKDFGVYNKVYGFNQGDVVIKFIADLLRKALFDLNNETAELFHLGGDDFAILAKKSIPAGFYQEFIERFQDGIVQYYHKDDVHRGGLVFNNRQGLMEQSPIMTIDLAVVSNRNRRITDWLEAETIGAELIKYSKTFPGSNWVKDRRRS